jgi:hypothetical protein
VCDVVEPWEHGTAVRCTAHPGFWDYNSLRVEGPDPEFTRRRVLCARMSHAPAVRYARLNGDERPRRR